MLNITRQDFIELMKEGHDEAVFNVLYNDIPKEGHSSNYIEDDGRQYRIFHFEDLRTGQDYWLNYTWYPDDSFEMYHLFTDLKEVGINLLENPPKVVEAPPEPIKTQAQKDDEALMEQYKAIEGECRDFNEVKKEIPVSVIDDIVNFMKTRKFSIYELRAKIIPYCIQYKITHKSFWPYLQKKAR
jgi:hypothetical protein